MDEDVRAAPMQTSAAVRDGAAGTTNPVRRLTLIVIGVGIALFSYGLIADRLTPYTSQALVQAYLVRIAPEVSGKVIEIGAETDQRVSAGGMLFRIDPSQYEVVVRRAEAALAGAGQSIGASTASVVTAQAKLAEASAQRENVREQSARVLELVRKGVYAPARETQAKTALATANAAVAHAESEVERARQTLGPKGADNPQIREAMGALEQANMDLAHTTVLAPSDGGVTNLSLGIGQFVAKGEPAMTYIDVREIWVEAAFRENSLEHVEVGDRVEIVLDIRPGRVLTGRVAAIGFGVGNRNVDARTGLPNPKSQSGWTRPAQPLPVRIEFDGVPPTAVRFGSQANVMVYTGDNSIVNALGWLKMRAIALISYVN